MDIDIESIALLAMVLRDSPKERQYVLCVLARSNAIPTQIRFFPNSEYPTFYGYSNERIPFYLMGKRVISNVPREGYAKRILSSHNLSLAEVVINRAANWDINQRLTSITKLITLNNNTQYHEAEVFLVFRDRAYDYIREYATTHSDKISAFLGSKLGRLEFGSELLKTLNQQERVNPPLADKNKAGINWPTNPVVKGNKFIFDEHNWIIFTRNKYPLFKDLFDAEGLPVPLSILIANSKASDPARTLDHIADDLVSRQTCPSVRLIKEVNDQGQATRRLQYTLPK